MFLWSRHWCFCGRGSRDRGLRSSVRRRHCFFLGENLRAAQKNPKNADAWTRWTSKRVLVGDFMREDCRSAARQCDGFKPTSSHGPGRRRMHAAWPARAGGGAAAAQNVNDGRNPEFARGAMRRLCGADGNPVQTTAPPTAPAALATTTCTCLPALATAVRQDERRRQRVAAILQELRPASAEYPRSAGQRTVRWARRTSRLNGGAGGGWCGVRKAIDLYHLTLAPLLPHASDLADTALQLPNSSKPDPR